MNTYLAGLDVLGAEIFGAFDIQAVKKDLNPLPVTVEIARILVGSGLDIIVQAIQGAKQPWYKPDLPRQKARDGVFWKLKWHEDQLSKIVGDPQAPYAHGADLKKWVAEAYIEANAVEEGSARLANAWTSMWREIGQKLAAMPREALKLAAEATGMIVESVTGVPLWAWALGGTFVVALLGFVAFKVATGPVGGAVARKYLRV